MPEAYSHFLQHPVFKVVSELSSAQDIPAYVICGFVRDSLLGRPCKDIDIVVVGDGPAFAAQVANKLRVKNLSIYKRYGTAHFRYKDLDVEFVGARKESYTEDSRNPATVPGTLQDDQLRRDFTVNALAFNLHQTQFGALEDPFNGLKDLDQGNSKNPT